MARKKKTNEEDYEVDLVDKDPSGKASKTTKSVRATSSSEALRRATQGDPRVSDYEEITVKDKNNPSGAPVTKTESKKPKTKKSSSRKSAPKIDPNTMELIEGIDYPYSIMLPGVFEDFMSKMLKEQLEPRNGKVYVRIPNRDKMVEFVSNVMKSRDKKAKIVRNGIMESLS